MYEGESGPWLWGGLLHAVGLCIIKRVYVDLSYSVEKFCCSYVDLIGLFRLDPTITLGELEEQ